MRLPVRSSFALSPLLVAMSIAAPGARAATLPPGQFDYMSNAQICLLGQCSTNQAPGRVAVLGSGKIAVFFSNATGTALQSNGVLLELGRTVSLSGRGRLPATVFGNLVPQGGSGTARFDGTNLTLVVDILAAGPARGGTVTVRAHLINVFTVDPSGTITGGTGLASGRVQGVAGNGQPFSGDLSGSATIVAR